MFVQVHNNLQVFMFFSHQYLIFLMKNRYIGDENELGKFLYAIDFYPPGGCENSSGGQKWCVEFEQVSFYIVLIRSPSLRKSMSIS